MIEVGILFLLFFSTFFIFISFIRKLNSLYLSFPEVENIYFRHFLIPKIDLETLAPTDILNELNVYREIKNPRYPISDLSIDEIEKNYNRISTLNLLSENKNSNSIFSKVILDLNLYFIRNNSLPPEINVLEKKLTDSLNIKKEELSSKLNGFSLSILLTQFLILTSLIFSNDYHISESSTKFLYQFSIILIFLTLLLFVLIKFIYFTNTFINLRSKVESILSKLENHILPVYSNDMSTEIRILGSRLNNFNSTFKEYLVRLERLLLLQEKNFIAQESNLEVLKSLHPEKILETSARVMSSLDKDLKSLETLSSDIKVFGQALKSSSRFLEIIETLFDKASDAELNLKKIATGVSLRLEESGKLLEFLGSHISTLENRKEQMDSIIISTDNALKESYRELTNSEQEILHRFQETTEISMEEYKKVMNNFLNETSEISREIISGLRNLESTLGTITSKEGSTPHHALEDYFSRLESSISTTHMKLLEREDKILSTFLQKKEPDSFLSTVQIESPKSVETELNKLLTQINVNQMYFENVLKELLKELRMESKQRRNISEISFWKLFVAKWSKFRGKI